MVLALLALAAQGASEPVAIDGWLIAEMSDEVIARHGGDPVLDALANGTFEPPEEGTERPAGVRWARVPAGPNGEVQRGEFRGRLYAVGRFAAEESGAVVREDRVVRVYINGAPQPGDVYGSGRVRVPGRLRAGENLVVALCLWRGSDPVVRVEPAAAAVAFNLADTTAPDFRAGESAAQPLGIAILNLTDEPLYDVRAVVADGDRFRATELAIPALAPLAVTQVAFELSPKRAAEAAGETWQAALRIESPSLAESVAAEIDVRTVARDAPFRRTFVSGTDGSVQYYSVLPPAGDAAPLALVLSLHGAGMEATAQAASYSQRDGCVVVCPTNRRPFGFDWEDWGRRDAIEALDDAARAFAVDPERTYLTGHSMGGHGTWHVGVLHADRFGAIAPSAGWASFATYAGSRTPSGAGVAEALARGAAASNTFDYLANLAGRGIYILHGEADDNVPVAQGRTMAERAREVTEDLVYHEQPGAGHWWDGPDAPGTDCVDWPPLFEFLRAHRRDPVPLAFRFRAPSPWVNPTFSFITVRCEEDPYADVEVESRAEGDAVELTTRNVRSIEIDGAALRRRGVARITVDGRGSELPDGPLVVGEAAKRPGVHGPLKEVFYRPFAFAYGDGAPALRRYASYLVSLWSIRGNGRSFALPVSRVTPELRREVNVVYVGVSRAELPMPDDFGVPPLEEGCAAALVFPDAEAGRLAAWIGAAAGAEALLYEFGPFVSGLGFPDFVVWSADVRAGGWGAARRAGFFDADWRFDRRLARP